MSRNFVKSENSCTTPRGNDKTLASHTHRLHKKTSDVSGRIHYYLNLQTNNFDRTQCCPDSVLGFNSNDIKNLGLVGFVKRIHSEDVEPLAKEFERNCEDKDLTEEIRYRFMDKNGSYQWVRDNRFVLYHNNKAKAIIGTIFNITDPKAHDQAFTPTP